MLCVCHNTNAKSGRKIWFQSLSFPSMSLGRAIMFSFFKKIGYSPCSFPEILLLSSITLITHMWLCHRCSPLSPLNGFSLGQLDKLMTWAIKWLKFQPWNTFIQQLHFCNVSLKCTSCPWCLILKLTSESFFPKSEPSPIIFYPTWAFVLLPSPLLYIHDSSSCLIFFLINCWKEFTKSIPTCCFYQHFSLSENPHRICLNFFNNLFTSLSFW